MAPMKRPRAESEASVGSGAAPPASKRPRAVSSRVDTGLRAAAAVTGAVGQQPRPPLKRPPLAPRQPGQDRPAAVPRAATVPKVDTLSQPAAVTDDQREAWRAARRLKLAERILRGRQGSAAAGSTAACLGMDADRQRSAAPSRPRAVPSRLLQPRPTAAAAATAAAPARPVKRAASAASVFAPRPRPATVQGPPPAIGGIRLNKTAQRRLTLVHARRQQAERDAERRRTLAAPMATARPAARPLLPLVPGVPRRQTFAGSRPAPAPSRRPVAGAARRSPAAPVRRSPRSAAGSAPGVTAVKTGTNKQRLALPPVSTVSRRQTFAGSRPVPAPSRRPVATAPARRSPRSAPGSAPRVTAVKTGMSKQRLEALARPRQVPQKRPSPPPRAAIVKPVQRRPTVVPTVGGSLAPPTGLPDTMRRSLSAMHRSRSTSDRSAAVHRLAGRDRASSVAAVLQEDEMDTATATAGPAIQVTEAETAERPKQPTATPAKVRQSAPTPARARQSAPTPARARQSGATPARARPSGATPAWARQSGATPARARPSGATPARAGQSVTKARLPSEQTLQERLEQWLARRGKQLSSFKHLHCFGKELTQPTPSRAQAAKARRSAAPRIQLDPGSPSLRATPTVRESETSLATPVTATKVTPASSAEKMAAPAALSGPAQMDNVLSDLRELQELGLPSDQVVSWLERLSRDPASAGSARYWLCRATAAEQDGQVDAVLHCFRQASHAKAEPVVELISGLQQFVQRAAGSAGSAGTPQESSEDAENAPPAADTANITPARRRRTETRRPLLDRSNVFDSSVIKYALIDDETVLKKLAALRLGETGSGDILSVITPVRRSTRSKSLKPPANPHLALFDSVEAISESLRRSALFRKNSALMSP